MSKNDGPKVLLLDIETAPILASVWGLFDQTISLNQIQKDWHILSFAAKWLNESPNKIIYMDQRNSKNIEDDRKLLEAIWKLLDECDVLISQNGVSFDVKKLNARFVMNGMKPPSSFKNIDTLRIARKKFSFTSNKLEYMTDKLCTKYKKLKHGKFAGFELWKECLAGNPEAWEEMKKYNINDVLSLEELYHKLQPWDNTVNFDLYRDSEITTCNCGGKKFQRRGFHYTKVGKYQKFQCLICGAWSHSSENLFSKDKRKSLKR